MRYSEKEERGGYPWLFFHPSNQWKFSLLVSLAILVLSVGFFIWCTRVSDDTGGDSFAGLFFAVTSTIFMFLASVAFSLQRRGAKRSVGKLNAALNWHICFGVIALVMVFLHAFGNYNPRTGTYALYGMIALVISGAIGRVLDRMLPRIIAQNVRKALTAQGDDRIESISRNVYSTLKHKKQDLRTSQPLSNAVALPDISGRPKVSEEQDPWNMDVAYISLEQTSLKSGRDNSQYRSLNRSATLYPSAQKEIRAIEEVQQAIQQETFFRYIIRYWRIFHICLAILTVALTLWHIEYALSLVIPALQTYGFGYLLPWP
jgi:hypothetical protein